MATGSTRAGVSVQKEVQIRAQRKQAQHEPFANLSVQITGDSLTRIIRLNKQRYITWVYI